MAGSRRNGAKTTPARIRSVGFVLVDSALRPIYANAEAVKILVYPKSPRKTRHVETLLIEKVQSIFRSLEARPESPCCTEFVSGRRHYLCRLFPLSPSYSNGAGPARALLLERNRECPDLSALAAKFKLTQREQQVVELLVQGLTSKEIADRMHISPNTVKAFLRLVMGKTGVTTRSGLVAIFLRSQPT